MFINDLAKFFRRALERHLPGDTRKRAILAAAHLGMDQPIRGF